MSKHSQAMKLSGARRKAKAQEDEALRKILIAKRLKLSEAVQIAVAKLALFDKLVTFIKD